MNDELLIETNDGISIFTLNRPEKRNALNDALISQLKTAFKLAADDAGLRAIVLRGAGKDFCSGADLSALQKKILKTPGRSRSCSFSFANVRFRSSPRFTAERWPAAVD